MTGRAVALPAARPLGALWRFSRPHTIIGTTVSIVALYLIAVDTLPGLALDSGAGFAILSGIAGDAADPLSPAAAALRAHLIKAYPQLRQAQERTACPA